MSTCNISGVAIFLPNTAVNDEQTITFEFYNVYTGLFEHKIKCDYTLYHQQQLYIENNEPRYAYYTGELNSIKIMRDFRGEVYHPHQIIQLTHFSVLPSPITLPESMKTLVIPTLVPPSKTHLEASNMIVSMDLSVEPKIAPITIQTDDTFEVTLDEDNENSKFNDTDDDADYEQLEREAYMQALKRLEPQQEATTSSSNTKVLKRLEPQQEATTSTNNSDKIYFTEQATSSTSSNNKNISTTSINPQSVSSTPSNSHH
ncbi:hypothetical protein INT46_001898 [Mucor plumbeus]|uniref:Uncharacterized protein n=1 Tax=Mucor plumbeus TaxID=97098 RepID=A0A8H7QDW6_9FUNG|nr:hypothetical protein INT46_001898 [Mucor plumbeus]